MDTRTEALAPYPLSRLVGYMLRLGAIGFGGPVALAGYMHRDLVEKRGWIAEADYREGLALAQLMPGPLAAQLAMYLGYVHYRVRGATLVGIAFVMPSFLMVVALGWAYLRYGGLPWMQAVFYGVGAAVIGIIAVSAWKLTRKTVGADRMLWAIYLVAFAVTVITESEIAWLFVLAGVVAWFVRAPPDWAKGRGLPVAAAAMPEASGILSSLDWPLLGRIAVFFGEAGAFVFGSGLAIVPFLYGGVVTQNHWLTERQFVDAVAVAMITPGPVVITVGFIGYLIAGLAGALVAALATFVPCYLFTILPAPYFKKYGKLPAIVAAVDGVTAAAIGAISGAVVVLARRSIVDTTTALLAVATVVVMLKVKRATEPLLIAVAAVVGLALFPATRAFGAAEEPMPQLVRTIPLPDVRGRIDHLDIDREGRRLFVAALGNDTVEVIDLREGRRATRIEGMREPQGVAYVAAARRLYAANGGGGLDAFSGESLGRLGAREPLDDADNIRVDSRAGRLYVGYGSALAEIDSSTGRLVRRIALSGHPEAFQLEATGPRIFVNVPSARQVVVVDRKTGASTASWGLGDVQSNFPMALDERQHRLFVGARRPATLLVLDTDAGRRVASVAIGGDADDVFFDAERSRILAICGEGMISVVQQDGADAYRSAGRVTTAPGARTGFWDAASRTLYVAAPARGSEAARILVYEVK